MTTRPGEMSRIKHLAGDDAYRQEVLVLLAILNERSEQSQEWQSKCDTWMIDHDKKDEVRFAAGEERMERIEANVGTVSSGVNDYENKKAQVMGARKLIVGTAIVMGAIYGCYEAIISVLEHLGGKQP